ncbi:MAG: AraC family transcriptional regulator [Acidihalobacter sp.]|uniref:AraC family transcriptional regulator n=1 Tax=Acidihalobacter sp. TaxID=1872108 RepID=UPI00307FB3F6
MSAPCATEFSDALSVRDYGAAPGRHVHDHFQVLWALQGSLELEIEGRGMSLDFGEATLLRPGERHDFESRLGSRCLVLDTRDPVWERRSARPQSVEASHHLAMYLALSLQDGATASSELGTLLLGQAWGEAHESRRARRDVDWARLTQWVLRRLAQPLTAADLAERALLSESQFRQRCVGALGCSPMQWVRTLRLERARELRADGMRVAEIARRTGYRSPSALRVALERLACRGR